MSTQTIDFNNVQSVYFDNNPCEAAFLNNDQIWPLGHQLTMADVSVIFEANAPFYLSTANNSRFWNGDLYYASSFNASLDDPYDGWTLWNSPSPTIPSFQEGTKHYIILKGLNNTYITGSNATSSSGAWRITKQSLSGDNLECKVYGNIAALLDYTYLLDGLLPPMASYAFTSLFAYPSNSNMTQYEGVVDASELVLPFETMTASCYRSMFFWHTRLRSAPSLKAMTTTAERCCFSMFNSTYINELHELKPTVLATSCYQNMYQNCQRIRVSTSQNVSPNNEFRIPSQGTGSVSGSNTMTDMFKGTGAWTGTPSINTTYYTSNEII